MTRSGIWFFFSFFLYLLIQVMLLKNLVLFNTAFCFLYVAYILFLPTETNILALMVIAFFTGFVVDIFYNSLGVHASALVAIAYLRNYWLRVITPQGGYEINSVPSLEANGTQWFLVYTIPLIVLHHFILFIVEAGGFHGFGYTSMKMLFSVLFTMTILVILQLLTTERRRI
ncbi:MAG: rod shape-determining protein MreD [Bacteroidota bacterium]